MEKEGYTVGNIDATIIAQRPKMAPHIPVMRKNIAEVLRIEESQINIKATTEEGLGFTGSGEGISSQAVCLLFPAEYVYDLSLIHIFRAAPIRPGDPVIV